MSNVFTLHLPQNAILNRNQPGIMDSYGRYTVSYTPSDDPTEYLQTSVQMSISSVANLSDMSAFFTDFLRACGYVFDGALEIVQEDEEYAFSKQYWQDKFFKLLYSDDNEQEEVED